MDKCYLKKDLKTVNWLEEEIKKIDPQIKELGLPKPALRALVNSSIYSVKTLKSKSVEELKSLHGMGPTSMKKIMKNLFLQ